MSIIECVIIGGIVGYVVRKIWDSPRARYIIRWGQWVSKEDWEKA